MQGEGMGWEGRDKEGMEVKMRSGFGYYTRTLMSLYYTYIPASHQPVCRKLFQYQGNYRGFPWQAEGLQEASESIHQWNTHQ